MAAVSLDDTPDPRTLCYAELASVIDRWLPLIDDDVEREQLIQALRSLRRAASIQPLRPLD